MEREGAQSLSRGRFLRRLGVFAAAGLGAGVLARPAYAIGRCCRQPCDPGETCNEPNHTYGCNGCGLTCCICSSSTQTCFDVPCPCG